MTSSNEYHAAFEESILEPGPENALQLPSSSKNGLPEAESGHRLHGFDYNTPKTVIRSPALLHSWSQFVRLATIQLVAAVLLAMILGDFTNALIYWSLRYMLFTWILAEKACCWCHSGTLENGSDPMPDCKKWKRRRTTSQNGRSSPFTSPLSALETQNG